MSFNNIFDSSLVDYHNDFEENDRKYNFFNKLYDEIDTLVADYIYQSAGCISDTLKFHIYPELVKADLKKILTDNISGGGVDEHMWFVLLNKDDVKKYLDVDIPGEYQHWSDKDIDKIDEFYNKYYNDEMCKETYKKKIYKRILEIMQYDIQEEIKNLED